LKRRFAHSDVEGARIVSARRFTPPGPACEMLFVVREARPIVVLGIELRLGKAVVDAFAAHALRLLPCLGATALTFCRSPGGNGAGPESYFPREYSSAARTRAVASWLFKSDTRIRALSGASNATAPGLRQLPRHSTIMTAIPSGASRGRNALRSASPNCPLRGVSRGQVRHIAIVFTDVLYRRGGA